MTEVQPLKFKENVNLGNLQVLNFNSGLLANSIFQSLPFGILIFDKDLRIIEANPQAANMVELGQFIDKTLETEVRNFPTLEKNWSGQLQSVISKGTSLNFEGLQFTRKNKNKIRTIKIICSPLKTANGEIFGGSLILEDITEKLNIQHQLENSEKLAAIGKLASKVAHELNNPLDGIQRYLNLSSRAVEKQNHEKLNEYLEQCRQGVSRMAHIVSELLEFSRSRGKFFEKIKIEEIIDDAIKSMSAAAENSNVKIETDYHHDIPKIAMGNLYQVFCNLIKNAVSAMPNGGKLRITTCLTEDKTIIAEFRDTGTGFAPEHTDLLFEPFFTTKEKDKGTGLGLAICKDIVERYSGKITAENTPGGGSIFTVFIPLREN